MSGVNKVILLGRVGKDPEVRTTQGGKDIAKLSLATSDSWKDKQTGERKEVTEWHNVSFFAPGHVKLVGGYIRKGDMIYVEGKIKTDRYERDGQERYFTSIVVEGYGGRVEIVSSKADNQQVQAQQKHSQEKGNAYVQDDLDDEIPY